MSADLLGIVRKGDLRASLEAIRDLLAERLVVAEAKESASVAKQLMTVLVELDRLPNEHRESVSDELAKQYADRIAGSENQ